MKNMVNLERLKIESFYLFRRAMIIIRPGPGNPVMDGDISSPERAAHTFARYNAFKKEDELEIRALNNARQKGLEAESYKVFSETLSSEESQIPPLSMLYERAKQRG